MAEKFKIRKGDRVVGITGRDKVKRVKSLKFFDTRPYSRRHKYSKSIAVQLRRILAVCQ